MYLSNHSRQLLVARSASRRILCVVAGFDAIGYPVRRLNQLRPNGLPVIRTKHLAGNFPLGCLFDRGTVLNRNLSVGRHPLMDRTLRNAEDVGQCLKATDKSCGCCNGVFGHFGTWL
jgi:hypothetical protein